MAPRGAVAGGPGDDGGRDVKSEKEIREHRDAIRLLKRLPCGCPGTSHESECRTGLLMMAAVEHTLSWALGEYPKYQPIIDKYNAAAREAQAESN